MKVSELLGRPVHKVSGHLPVHGQSLEVPDLISLSLGSFLLLLPRGTSHSGVQNQIVCFFRASSVVQCVTLAGKGFNLNVFTLCRESSCPASKLVAFLRWKPICSLSGETEKKKTTTQKTTFFSLPSFNCCLSSLVFSHNAHQFFFCTCSPKWPWSDLSS